MYIIVFLCIYICTYICRYVHIFINMLYNIIDSLQFSSLIMMLYRYYLDLGRIGNLSEPTVCGEGPYCITNKVE